MEKTANNEHVNEIKKASSEDHADADLDVGDGIKEALPQVKEFFKFLN